MNFHFIDFVRRAGNTVPVVIATATETQMSFRPALILATVLAPWPVLDITENPKKWKFVEADAAQAPLGVKEFILTRFKGAVLPSW